MDPDPQHWMPLNFLNTEWLNNGRMNLLINTGKAVTNRWIPNLPRRRDLRYLNQIKITSPPPQPLLTNIAVGVTTIFHLERDCRLGVDRELPEQGEGGRVDETHLPARGCVEATYTERSSLPCRGAFFPRRICQQNIRSRHSNETFQLTRKSGIQI